MAYYKPSHLNRLAGKKGFTTVELIMVSLILSLIAGGIWAVYYSVVNTYYVEQSGSSIQREGERIIDLITNGGHMTGRRIYGLNSSYPLTNYPVVGYVDHADFNDFNYDYKIGFTIDEDSTNRRYAIFYVDFDDDESDPTSKLYFKLFTSSGNPADENYDENDDKGVLITENLLMRRYDSPNQDSTKFGNCDGVLYNKTWFKAQLLPKDGSSNYYSGIRISFYLVDITKPLCYNYQIDRKLIDEISDPSQKRSFLGGIPYPKYFSTTIYFPNRVD